MSSRISRFMSSVKKTQKATGWSSIKAINSIYSARKSGISHRDYVEDKCYAKNEKQLAKYIEKNNADKDVVNTIVSESGVSIKKANAMFKAAEKKGITGKQFIKYELWNATPEDIENLCRIQKLNNTKMKLEVKWQINLIAEKSGCSFEEAKKKRKAMLKHGDSFYQFIKHAKYMLSPEEIMASEVNSRLQHKSIMDNDNTRRRIEEIKEEMGWNNTQFRINLFESKVASGATFLDYEVLEFYKKSPEEQKKYITHETWLKLYLRHCDYAENWKYFKDKTLFNEKFSDFIKRKWAVTENMDRAAFDDFIEGEDEIIYKPTDQACGIGIKRYPISENSSENDAVFKEITETSGMIETIIKQHPYLDNINSGSVNTIRVHTIRWKGEARVCNAALRMGVTEGKGTDNFHDGGAVVPIDIKTGKAMTEGVLRNGQILDYHPISNISFKDICVPCWDKVLETALKAAERVDKMNYAGWDVVVNSDGSTQLIEGNHDGGVRLFQFPLSLCKNEGIRYTIDEYLWFDENEKTI